MQRRNCRKGRRNIGNLNFTTTYKDPAFALGATYGWSASGAVINAGVVDSLSPDIGTVSLIAAGVKPTVPIYNSDLNGQLAIPFVGSDRGFASMLGVTLADGITLISVVYVNTNNCGISSTTTNGTNNTGISQFHFGGDFYSRSVGYPDVLSAKAQPVAAVLCSVFPAGGVGSARVSHYVNSLTPTLSGVRTSITATANRIVVADTEGAAVGALRGAWARTRLFPTALSAGNVAILMNSYGKYYNITIAP